MFPAGAAEGAQGQLHSHPEGHGPAVIGAVIDNHPGTVELRSPLGGGRILDLLSGEQMPRIC